MHEILGDKDEDTRDTSPHMYLHRCCSVGYIDTWKFAYPTFLECNDLAAEKPGDEAVKEPGEAWSHVSCFLFIN